MDSVHSGQALCYGDNINTDIISPPQYMELPLEEAVRHAMAPVDPDFARKVTARTILVAGKNFGSGSSRETAPLALRKLGIRIVVATFFARIFYRNAINIGLLAIECPEAGSIQTGDQLELDVEHGLIHNVSRHEQYACNKMPAHIMALIEQGGLVPSLRRLFAANNV